jgi:hypothetical protein
MLYNLLFGKKKTKLSIIMTDEKNKVENYKKAREKSGVIGWHQIEPADPKADVWRQKRISDIGGGNRGNKNNCGPLRINRHGKAEISGYITKHGFQSNT